MKYLLDTHTLLWIVEDSEKLGEKAKQLYLDNSNDIYLSIASLWEMAIKISIKKLDIQLSLSKFVEKHILGNNIQLLNIMVEHVSPLETLPFHHRDPFDRIIISQCIQEKMALISKDRTFDAYQIERIW